MDLIKDITEKLKGKNVRIVFPEGEDKRILGACARLAKEGVVVPVVLGKRKEVEATAKELGVDLSKLEFVDIEKSDKFDELCKAFVERRKGKVAPEDAKKILMTPNYFGTMMVYKGYADGLVSGAVGTTADTVRPALQIIKTVPGMSKTSGAFFMLRDDEMYLMADCAINIDPNSDDLAEIAVASDKTARQFGMEPKIAMLSFSTKGSASHELVDKVADATAKALEMNPDLDLDGELQFDAAFVPSVGEKKAPGSKVAGHANVFVFPSLEAGNIGYKIGQRFGGFEAIGPVLQGLNSPVNDLSRGCNEDEVLSLAKVTAAQAKL
ncbi:MAG: phosphate acetyltransferase [Clostridiales bacterium]|nr:phosphate acetyltransferase [Clostridiales bacterium]MDY6116480.1 phosphate acetyltransferase [Anaerovoracaceae bacterium]